VREKSYTDIYSKFLGKIKNIKFRYKVNIMPGEAGDLP